MAEADRTPPTRRDRLVQLERHDTYKLRGKLKEPTVCPQCGAVFHKGRWAWLDVVPPEAEETTCPACNRSNDDYPAGEVILSGSFLSGHKREILDLAENIEAAEKPEHPMNRIMKIEDGEEGEVRITTTDEHLPRRIGRAIAQALEGELDIHFDEAGNFTRVTWHRDD